MPSGETLLFFLGLLGLLLLCVLFCRRWPDAPMREAMTSTSTSTTGTGGVAENTTTTFYGPNGETASLTVLTNGSKTVVVTDVNGNVQTFTAGTVAGSDTLYGPAGATVTIVQGDGGAASLTVTYPDGRTVKYVKTRSGNVYSTSSYDNYNHYDGTSYAAIFYGPNGNTARIVNGAEGRTIVVTERNGTTTVYYINKNATHGSVDADMYYGPNGGTAKIITDGGKTAIEIVTPAGQRYVYYDTDVYAASTDATINQYVPSATTYGTDYNSAFTATTVTGPAGNTATAVTGPAGNTYATYDNSAYYNSLPAGIPRSQIPAGQEDLYILKSEVVPPVCPKCPDPIVQCPDKFDATKCPPCPPCARCPEPAFDCKKVPNYSAFGASGSLPLPVLNDFSQFGM